MENENNKWETKWFHLVIISGHWLYELFVRAVAADFGEFASSNFYAFRIEHQHMQISQINTHFVCVAAGECERETRQ